MRLFLALQPRPGEYQHLLEAVPKGYRRGRRVPVENLHLTLVFLGACSEVQVARIREVAAATRVAGGQISLSRLAVWPGPRVQVLETWSRRVPDWLARLHLTLAQGLRAAGFPLEARPFRPHVTLARKCPPHEDIRVVPVRLHPQEFVLMASESGVAGVRYPVLARWPLMPPGRGARESADME
ncbi:MAG: RNA 2',3'-cyclic phosphodiesterase [Ectothiorhodospiraceae bacterium]|nr:RNA 2',3'-cyclic phosphodiesterase [Ectothiorhodospiraceae bacterium]